MPEDKKFPAGPEAGSPPPGERPPAGPVVYASPTKRAWAWVGVVYMLLFTAAFTYHLATGRLLYGLGPLFLCPALGGLCATSVLRYRAGKGRGGLPVCVGLAGLCALLLLLNLWVGVPSLLRNFGGG